MKQWINTLGFASLSSLLLLVVTACTPGVANQPASKEAPPTAQPQPTTVVTLMTHDSFDVSEEVIAEFERDTGIKVQLLPSGDAGSALNQAILSKNNPLADVFFGVDSTFLSRALSADIFESYPSPVAKELDQELLLDPEYRLLPVDYGDVCLNYDKARFNDQGIQPPGSLESLIDPIYRGLTVVENPATSSPGLAFLLATIGHFGESGYLDFWADLRANDVLVVDGWEEAYWGQFSAASDGDRPIVVSYASSPPVEVFFAEEAMEEAPTGVVLNDGACFRQIEFVGILKGSENQAQAQQLVDFLLSKRFQEDVPLQMFVFPANESAELPEVFVEHAQVPAKPATVLPQDIENHRETWIEAWTETVLR